MNARCSFTVAASPGVTVSVSDLGGAGHKLLFLGANGFHGLCYVELVKHLRGAFHCFAVDLRGQGDSQIDVPEDVVNQEKQCWHARIHTASDNLPTLAGYVQDVAAVLSHLECKECYIFGHSSGGCAALAAALKLKEVKAAYIYEPVMISQQVLRSRPSSTTPQSNRLFQMAMKRRDRFPSKQAAFDSLGERGFKHFDKHVLWDYVNHGFQELPGGECQLKCSRVCEALVYATIEEMSAPIFEALGDLSCPVIVAAGGQDPGHISVSDRAPPVAAQLGNGRLEKYEHLDHFGPFVQPAYIARRVLLAFGAETVSRL